MIVNEKLVPALKKALLTATALVALMRCSEEEFITPSATTAATETSARSAEVSITSLTISGVNTVFATAKDCKTCTYVVPEGTTLVDGKLLGFKPGNIICLNSIFKYGAIEFSNIEGSAEQPIVITTVGENVTDYATEQTSFTGDPY